RAKGVSTAGVLYKHVLRNALIPIVTLLGLSLPGIFGGALITEAVFNYPGMGLLFWDSAQTRDYPVLLGVTIVVALATVVGNLLADVFYAVVDPRVRITE
ncbi:MAG: ABC transporter permease, partial [Chloroflexi bacterium]